MFNLFIDNLMELNKAEVCLLRNIDRDIKADILFADLWQSYGSKYRNILRLITKLYANYPLKQAQNWTIESQLDGKTMATLRQMPIHKVEPLLHREMRIVARNSDKMDWIQLANQLINWNR
jgi:hypothetical protein